MLFAGATRSFLSDCATRPTSPWALFGRGDPTLLAKLPPEGAVTVVGARKASSYGRELARALGHELAGAGLLVIGGLAFGVDACAHRGALQVSLIPLRIPLGERSTRIWLCSTLGE